MRVATEAIYDPYGGLYSHTAKFKKFSSHRIIEIPSGVTRILVNRSPWFRQRYRQYRSVAGLNGFDIVHSRSDPWFMDVCRRSMANGCVWVHTYHAMFHEEDYTNGLEPWQKEINRALIEVASHADIRISVSKWGHDHLLKEYSIDTVVIENGADLEISEKADPERFFRKYGIKGHVLFVGSFREVKNPVLFLELADRLPEKGFVMIGDGMDARTLTEKYGVRIPGNVKFLGRMPHPDVIDAMAACSVYVMTSKHEGLPHSLLEAMALAKPVVVPAHTGCKELVPTEEYGFLYDIGSIDELVKKTREAAVSPGVGLKARERVEQNYDWKVSALKLDQLYESCKRRFDRKGHICVA